MQNYIRCTNFEGKDIKFCLFILYFSKKIFFHSSYFIYPVQLLLQFLPHIVFYFCVYFHFCPSWYSYLYSHPLKVHTTCFSERRFLTFAGYLHSYVKRKCLLSCQSSNYGWVQPSLFSIAEPSSWIKLGRIILLPEHLSS